MRELIKPGFTLIEFLVCLAVIGLLATLFLTNYRASQRQARNTQRKSDLNQYRNALETYATAYDSLYPSRPIRELISANVCTGSGGDLDSLGFMTSCPQDPRSGETTCGTGGATECDYYYVSNAEATAYVLSAALEAEGCWLICSTGQVGQATSCPATAACPL